MNCPGVEDDPAAVAGQQQEVVVVEQQPEEQELVEAQTAVVSVVDAGSQEVLHQVHFTMEVDGTTQEQQVSREKVPRLAKSTHFTGSEVLTRCSPCGQVVVGQSQAEALAAAAAAGDNLICQAIINSGIALETEEAVVEETTQTMEEIHQVDSDCPDADEGITEIQVKEEFVEMETEVRMRQLLHCIVNEDMWSSV